MKILYKNTQKGLSLVELMVAMLIGLFIVGGVITSLMSTTAADKHREAISDMDARAQTALEVMRQAITHAGYPSINNIELNKAFMTSEDFPAGSSANTKLTNPDCKDKKERDTQSPRFKHITKDYGDKDKLTIISLADNPQDSSAQIYYDCMGGGMKKDAHDVACSTDKDDGMDNPLDAKLFSTFRINKKGGVPILYCDGNRGGTQPIVNNIRAMQFLYGVRQDNTKVVYKDATTVEAKKEWSLVNSVQIALLMRSEKENILDKPSDISRYLLLDRSIKIKSSQRRRMYRIYTTTINLENMDKAPLR